MQNFNALNSVKQTGMKMNFHCKISSESLQGVSICQHRSHAWLTVYETASYVRKYFGNTANPRLFTALYGGVWRVPVNRNIGTSKLVKVT
jgi:hypothetical protein